MRLELLLSVVDFENITDIYQHVYSANIYSDVIVVNQTNFCGYEELVVNNKMCRCISMVDRGVGLSRNTALMRTNADIAMFVDDDEVFLPGYEQYILDAFKVIPDADAIVFNVESCNDKRPSAIIKNIHRVRWYNFMRYGAYQIAIRTSSIRKKRLYFSTLFGGGCIFSSGEDSLFLSDMIDSELKIYAYPITVATVEQKKSTWFRGFDEKYFFDRGVLYSQIFRFPKLIGLIQLIRKRNVTGVELTFLGKLKSFVNGTKYEKRL